jgi:autophagy-related protein 16
MKNEYFLLKFEWFFLEKQQLLACLKDDTVKLIELRQNNVIYSFSHDQFQVGTDTNRAILSPNGQYACVGSQDGSLIIWNTTNGVCENVLSKKHSYEIRK